MFFKFHHVCITLSLLPLFLYTFQNLFSCSPESTNVVGNSYSTLAGATVSVIIFILLLTTVTVFAILIWLKRRGNKIKARKMTMGHVSDSIVGISNVLYQSNDVPVNTDKPGVCLSNAIYEGKLFLMHNSYESLILIMMQQL